MFNLTFFRKQKKWQLALAAFLFILIFLLSGRIFFEFFADHGEKNQSVEQAVRGKENESLAAALVSLENLRDEGIALLPPPTEVSSLTGLEIEKEARSKSIAVVIENHPGSRPQMRGLDEAGIVIEALVEGGITRFLAIFDSSDNKKIGPVRSARPYFVEWAEEFGGAFVHAGGSNDGIAKLVTSDLLDFDEDSEMLYRDFRYLQPHNLFVNLTGACKKVLTDNLPKSWFNFSEKLPNGETIHQFSIDFSLPNYFVEYVYDLENGNYRRFLAGDEHLTENGVVRPTNIVIQFTEYFPIDDAGRLELKTTGEGVAWFFSGGKMWRGSWRKTNNRTQFFDSFGKSVTLLPGQTFVEILDSIKRIKLPV